MLPSVEVTVPPPVPFFERVSEKVWTLNVAVTVRAMSRVTVQPAEPEQAPPQAEKTEPPAGVAISVTIVPNGNGAAQVAPQLMPAGLEVIVPLPVPLTEVVNVNWPTPDNESVGLEPGTAEALSVAVSVPPAVGVN